MCLVAPKPARRHRDGACSAAAGAAAALSSLAGLPGSKGESTCAGNRSAASSLHLCAPVSLLTSSRRDVAQKHLTLHEDLFIVYALQ